MWCVRQFSIAHLAALAALLVAGGLAVWLPPALSRPLDSMGARGVGGGDPRWLSGENVAEVVDGIWTVRYSLPLQLTDGVSLCAILALLTQGQLLIELVYFLTFSASLQAVLTPDLGSTFPSVLYFTYFVYHVGSIVAACLLVFGCRRYPRAGALWRVYGLTLMCAAIAALGDLITGGNYMYLAHKPVHGSLLDAMGPWPAYITSGAVLALAMFTLLAAIARAVQLRDPWPAADGHRLLP